MNSWLPPEIHNLSVNSHWLNNVLDVVPFPVYVADVATLKIVSVNRAMRAKTGAAPGDPCHWAIYRQESPCFNCRIGSLTTQPAPASAVCEHFNDRDDGWYQLHETLLTWFDDRVVLHSLAVDIGQLKLAQNELIEAYALLALKNAELERTATTDALTGLFNRRRLDQALQEGIERAGRTGQPIAVIAVDIDRFKLINDTHGHQAGDQVLRHVAEILRRETRSCDVVGRWGGEEFLFICPDTTADGAALLAEKLREQIEGFPFDDGIRATASFGVAASRPDEDAAGVIARADRALYRAKLAGRNRMMSEAT